MQLSAESLAGCFQLGKLRFLSRRRATNRWTIVVAVRIFGLVPNRVETVVIRLRDWVVFVGMAFRAAKCQPHPHLTGCVHTVLDGNRPKLFVIRAAFIVCRRVPVKSSRDFVFFGCIRQ